MRDVEIRTRKYKRVLTNILLLIPALSLLLCILSNTITFTFNTFMPLLITGQFWENPDAYSLIYLLTSLYLYSLVSLLSFLSVSLLPHVLLFSILLRSILILVRYSLCVLLFTIISSVSILYTLVLFALILNVYTLCSILFYFHYYFSVYTLYSLFLLFSLLILSVYTLCSLAFFFLFFSSSILTIISMSIRYTLRFTTSGIRLSKSLIVSNPCLHCSMVVRESACLLVVYFLRPSMITLAASKPGWESNFPSSSMVVHECTSISASKW